MAEGDFTDEECWFGGTLYVFLSSDSRPNAPSLGCHQSCLSQISFIDHGSCVFPSPIDYFFFFFFFSLLSTVNYYDYYYYYILKLKPPTSSI